MREYRSKEEVFDADSINSLSMKPIVNDHPSEMVTSNNINILQVGSVGEIIEKDDIFLSGNIVITDKEMVDTILNRKNIGLSTELSCGYSCMVIPEIGHHDSDGYYTFIQKKIKYNHVAIVDKARAGRQVKIFDKNQNKKEQKVDKVQFVRKAIKYDSLTLDSITQVIDKDSLELVNILSDKLDEAVNLLNNVNSKKDEFEAKYDQANEIITELKKKLDSLSNINSPVITAMLKERSDVEKVAEELGVKCEGKDIKTIKCDSIKSVSKNVDLNGRSDDYINARYEAVKDIVSENMKNDGNDDFSIFMKAVKDNKNKEKNNPRNEFINKDKKQQKK